MRRFCFGLLLASMAASAPALSAQTPSTEVESLDRVLFPPELIMQHRRAIDLTDEQRDAISRMIQELQGKVVGLQWQMLDEMQSLTEVLERPRVDLDRALDELDSVLDIEKRIKQAHLELLIRIKNLLEPEQLEALIRLRGEDAGGS
jgi:Spy/CpxP family protein refolding chaperone